MARLRILPITTCCVTLALATAWAAQQQGTATATQANPSQTNQPSANQAPAVQADGQIQRQPIPDQDQGAVKTIPLFRTNANLVLVDVVVRNRQQAVMGLKQEDFEVRESGKPQRITIFEEHRSTDAMDVAKAVPLPPHVYSDAPQYTLTSAANVLLLDGLNTPLADQVYVRRRMIQYLGTIPPGTRIAVFTLGSKLHVVTGFTTNAAEILKALESKRANAERSPALDATLDDTLNLQDSLAQSLGLSGLAVAGIEQFISDTENFEVGLREEMTIDALDQIARYLSTIPGRKNLIWFSASFPLRFLQGGTNPNMDPMEDFDGRVKKAAELLALSRVAVYPVDSRGLLNTPSSDASTTAGIPEAMRMAPAGGQGHVGGSDAGNTGIGSFSEDQLSTVNAQPGVGGEVQQKDQTMLNDVAFDHFNMEQIAKQTGGQAYYNRNALGQVLEEAIADGSSYYTIGYAPQDHNYNGAMRNIDVRVESGRYDLEYRHAYFADDPAKAVQWSPGRHNTLIDAMQHGTPPLSQVIFAVRVVPQGDASVKDVAAAPGPAGAMGASLKKPQRYIVDYWIDPRTVEHKTLPDGKIETQVELTEVAYNDEGIRVNYADRALGVSQTAEQTTAARGRLSMHEQIDLPPGPVYLRLGVHDLLSGRIGTVEVPLKTGD
jgi:VWFA-related protein